MLWRSFGSKGGAVKGDWRKSHNRELYYTFSSAFVIGGRKEKDETGEARGARVGGEKYIEVFGEET